MTTKSPPLEAPETVLRRLQFDCVQIRLVTNTATEGDTAKVRNVHKTTARSRRYTKKIEKLADNHGVVPEQLPHSLATDRAQKPSKRKHQKGAIGTRTRDETAAELSEHDARQRMGDDLTVSRCEDATTKSPKRLRKGHEPITETTATEPSDCTLKPRNGKPSVYKGERQERNRTKAKLVQRQLDEKLGEEQEQRLVLRAREARIVAQKDAEAAQARGNFIRRLNELEATNTALQERYTKAVADATERVQFLREKEIEAEALWEEALRQIELSHLERDRRQVSESDRARLHEQACNLEADVSKLRMMREEEEARRQEQEAKQQEDEARRYQAVEAAVISQQAAFQITSAALQDRNLDLEEDRRELTNAGTQHGATLDQLLVKLREQASELEVDVSKLRKLQAGEDGRRRGAVKAAVASQQAVFKITSASLQDRNLELRQARRELTNREAEHEATLDAVRFHFRDLGLPGLGGQAHATQPQSDASNGDASGIQPAGNGDRDPELKDDRHPQLKGDRDPDLAGHVKRLDDEIQGLKTAMLASHPDVNGAARSSAEILVRLSPRNAPSRCNQQPTDAAATVHTSQREVQQEPHDEEDAGADEQQDFMELD